MYYARARVPGLAGSSDAAAWPYGPVQTGVRQRCAKLLLASLPVLFALASFGPADVMVGAPHTQGHPVTSLPNEALRHISGASFDAPSNGGGGGGGTRGTAMPPYPSMSISMPPGGGSQYAAPPPPPPGHAVHEEPVAAKPGGGVTATKRRPAAGPSAVAEKEKKEKKAEDVRQPSVQDLQLCSISALVEPVVQVLKTQSAALESELQRNAEFQARVREAIQPVRQQLWTLRQHLQTLDIERAQAASGGDFGAAAVIRRRMDEILGRTEILESTAGDLQNQLDGLTEAEGALRHKQAGQLLWLNSELKVLLDASNQTIRRLQEEQQQLKARVETATEARANLGQALSLHAESLEVRRELRTLAEAAEGEEQRAAAELEADRIANRAALADVAALVVNLTRADSFARAAALELALLRRQMEFALQLQDYEHAERLASAVQRLAAAEDESAQSVSSFERLLGAEEALVRQRLEDHKHHLTRLERASELVQHVRNLRDMYGNSELGDAEAMSLAATLGSALESQAASQPRRRLSSQEAEAALGEVLA